MLHVSFFCFTFVKSMKLGVNLPFYVLQAYERSNKNDYGESAHDSTNVCSVHTNLTGFS